MLSLIPQYAAHGLKALDLNFCEMMNPSSELRDDGENYIRTLQEMKKELGLEYVQAHAPYPRDYRSLSPEDRLASDKMILASMRYAETLGIPHIVIHPIRGSVDDNVSYFLSLLDRCGGDIRIAIENMEGEDEIGSAEELLEIRERIGERAGICLDTGHAHMCGHSIPDFIHRAGDYLIATHIADNNGHKDEHLLPFFGTIDWESAMKAFNESYKGYLNYECMYFGKAFPQKSGEAIASLSYDIANLLLSLS